MAKYDNIAELRRPFLRKVVNALFCVFIVFYLGFHAVSGERGLFALFKETRRLEALEAELQAVVAERERLERKVQALSSASLDLDLLDERVREVLGVTSENEVVYFLSES